MVDANPVLIEVTRGNSVESVHRGSIVVADASGKIIHAWGNAKGLVFHRSAVKPLQALALVESGAADAFNFSDAELALACSSHIAAREHITLVSDLLARLGLSQSDLGCGPQTPRDKEVAEALILAGEAPTPVHNNCSGKHAGMLATALHLGAPVKGYMEPDHPVQRRVRAVLEEMAGARLDAAPAGIDGCGIPVYAMPLAALAQAMARFSDPETLGPERGQACRRIAAAMTAHPDLIAGRGRFDSRVVRALERGGVVKCGAEGVYGAALFGPGFGIAIKIDDGTRRAAETAMTAVLARLDAIPDDGMEEITDLLERPVTNAAGDPVGVIRPVLELFHR